MGRTLKMKVSATQSALNLLSKLQEKYGEKLMFHQSGGCCDGSAPMCFQEGEFPLGDNDIKLGEIGGVPFYMNGDQYEKWKHTDLSNENMPPIPLTASIVKSVCFHFSY